MRQLANSVMLSPEMNDMYKETCKALLQDALSSVEQVQRVVYVDCSFPSVPAEAPRLSLQKWVGMEHSEYAAAPRKEGLFRQDKEYRGEPQSFEEAVIAAEKASDRNSTRDG